MRLSNSSIKTFKDCRRRYYYSYILNLSPKLPPSALSIGTAVHKGLELYYSQNDKKLILDQTRAYFRDLQEKTQEESEYDRLELNKAISLALLTGYFLKYLSNEFNGEIRTEVKFEISELGFTGKVDGMVNIKSKKWLLEHKTLSESNIERYKDRLLLDAQPTAYLWGLQKLEGIILEGVLYNLIRKPLLKQRETETIEEFGSRMMKDCISRHEFYYQRHFVYRSQKEIKEFERELMEVIKDMKECKHFYRNTSVCSQYGECPFRRLCLEPDCEKELIEAYYEQNTDNR